MGRPKLPPAMCRTTALLVRMNAWEHTRLKKLADRAGVSMAEWVRKQVTERATS